MTSKIDKIIEILTKYADESGFPVRSTSDLSPLEDWLIAELASYMEAPQPTIQANARVPCIYCTANKEARHKFCSRRKIRTYLPAL